MMFDYKKEYKEFYMPKGTPSIVRVPKMNYIAVRGSGNPNDEDGEYKGAELSCIIGNIFTELRPPCDMCGGEAVTIHGITPTGHEATITLTAAGFDFEGCAEDTALLQRIRKARCIYAGTREGTQRAVRIQCDCEGERPCKAYLHDHEQHGALPEKIPFYAGEPHTGKSG